MRETLVLNRNFYAIQICDWTKSMSLLYRGQAIAVGQDFQTYDFESWRELSLAMADHPNGVVHTVSFTISVPEIIQLTNFDRLPNREVHYNRRTIYKHYNNRCAYCGNKFNSNELNIDHIIPKSRGGKTEWLNTITSCVSCNLKKGNRTPVEAGLKMFFQPSIPTWRPAYAVSLGHIKIKTSWEKFISVCYWNLSLED